jgi:hypothetical protein
MLDNKVIMDYSHISQKEIYRTMKALNLKNSQFLQINRQNLDGIKKQLNFNNYNTLSQEENHKRSKINKFVELHHNLKTIRIQLNFDNHDV